MVTGLLDRWRKDGVVKSNEDFDLTACEDGQNINTATDI